MHTHHIRPVRSRRSSSDAPADGNTHGGGNGGGTATDWEDAAATSIAECYGTLDNVAFVTLAPGMCTVRTTAHLYSTDHCPCVQYGPLVAYELADCCHFMLTCHHQRPPLRSNAVCIARACSTATGALYRTGCCPRGNQVLQRKRGESERWLVLTPYHHPPSTSNMPPYPATFE